MDLCIIVSPLCSHCVKQFGDGIVSSEGPFTSKDVNDLFDLGISRLFMIQMMGVKSISLSSITRDSQVRSTLTETTTFPGGGTETPGQGVKVPLGIESLIAAFPSWLMCTSEYWDKAVAHEMPLFARVMNTTIQHHHPLRFAAKSITSTFSDPKQFIRSCIGEPMSLLIPTWSRELVTYEHH